MSSFENVVGGRLKLKGKALNIKSGRVKKTKKLENDSDKVSNVSIHQHLAEESMKESIYSEEEVRAEEKDGGGVKEQEDDHLTAAERRYIEQRRRIDSLRMAKDARKSHRDRIQDFNQYLANMSEHYDIPKVGPG